MFISLLFQDPQQFFAIALIIVFSICCHEYMHAWTALKVGDSTAADRGHLTLNPLKQMGIISLIMLACVGIAWGQVPVNPSKMRGKYADALVSFAGPATNLVLSIIFIFLSVLVGKFTDGENEFAFSVLFYGGTVNLVLFIFNMIPVPGFDGWSIIRTFFPKLSSPNQEWLRGLTVAIMLLVFVTINYLFIFANFVCMFVASGFYAIIG